MSVRCFNVSISLATANQIYNIYEFLIAAGSATYFLGDYRVSKVEVEFDIAGTGNVYLGGPAVSSTNCGKHLVPSVVGTFSAVDSDGTVDVRELHAVADNNTQQLNITVYLNWRTP